VNCASKNPKDPTFLVLNALLDTGANCNVISNRFSTSFILETNSKRRIRFANTGNSQEATMSMDSMVGLIVFFLNPSSFFHNDGGGGIYMCGEEWHNPEMPNLITRENSGLNVKHS